MQTEYECGDGKNSWEYARYIFNLMRHYLANGVNSSIYWNMVLEPGGQSTWVWNQNSLITIDPDSGGVSYNPEFYLMKHLSHFIRPVAVRLKTRGHWSGSALAFESPDGDLVVVVSNAMARKRNFTVKNDNQEFAVELEPYSFNTRVF